MTYKDARNRAVALGLASRPITGLATFKPGANGLFGYGQSNSYGQGATPPTATPQSDGAQMFGTDAHWPFSGALASLAPSVCQPPEIEGAHRFIALHGELQRSGSRTLIVGNGAQGGSLIATLIKNHTSGPTEFYQRYLDFLTACGTSVNQLGVVWYQGESDYAEAGNPPPHVTSTRAQYKAALKSLLVDMAQDAASQLAFLCVDPGGQLTMDVDPAGNQDLFVSMATQELCQEERAAFLVGPIYQYSTTSDGVHLDGAAQQALGDKVAEVLHRVANLRLNWEPLSPLEIETDGASTYIHLLAPCPPTLSAPIQGSTLATLGFRGCDGGGSIPIDFVEQVAPTVWHIQWGRAPGSGVLYYAGHDGYAVPNLGRGNICDSAAPRTGSGPTYGAAVFGAGQFAPESAANWLVPFCLPLNWLRAGV